MSRLNREKKLMVVFPTTTDAMHMQQAAKKSISFRSHDTASGRTRGWMWACMVHIARTKNMLEALTEELGINTQGF